MKHSSEAPVFIFSDGRFSMSAAGRFFVRSVSAVSWTFFIIGAAMLLISDLTWARWIGIFLGLILVDRILHRHEGDVPVSELAHRSRINLAQALPPPLLRIMEKAYDRSRFRKTNFVLEAIVSFCVLPQVKEGLIRLDVNPEEFLSKAEEFVTRSTEVEVLSLADDAVIALLEKAFLNATKNGHSFIGVSDLFAAASASSNELVHRLFAVFGIEPGDMERALLFSAVRNRHRSLLGKLPNSLSGFIFQSDRGLRHRVVSRSWFSRPTPTLDAYSQDFTAMARAGKVGFMVGHDEEYQHLLNAVSRDSGSNILLIGETGTGKEGMVAHLALDIIKDRVPPTLFDKRVVALDIHRLMADGDSENIRACLQKIINEIVLVRNIILYIPEIHNLIRNTAFLPIINQLAVPVIAATTPRDLEKATVSSNTPLASFEKIKVNEVSDADAEKILAYQGVLMEQRSGIMISFGAVKSAVRLARKFFRNSPLPRSAIDLMNSALASAERRGDTVVTHSNVVAAAEARINIPLHQAGTNA